MALDGFQQFTKLIQESKHVLLVFSSAKNGDSIASALALRYYLDKEGKQVDVACSNFVLPKNLKFLEGSNTVQSELAHLQKFIVKVDVSKAPIETLSYDIKDNWLSIYLTPKFGTITKNELRTAQTTFKYDLIVAFGAFDLESLGDIFLNNTDLFYKTPIVNIDHQAENERYGQINLVNLTAASCAEIIFNYLKNVPEIIIDEALATMLLAGITVATRSFKQPHLSPQTLAAAGELVECGANREKIVQHLYRTRSIATLKLWGEALSRLKIDPELSLVYTSLTRDDFARSGASPEDLHGIVEELLSTAPEAKMNLILYETTEEKKIHGLLTVDKNYDAQKLVASFRPAGSKHQVTFILDKMTLAEAEEQTRKIIKAK